MHSVFKQLIYLEFQVMQGSDGKTFGNQFFLQMPFLLPEQLHQNVEESILVLSNLGQGRQFHVT